MSVMLNFAMFPTDKGTSVSEYVSKVIANIRDSGIPYKLNPMGTTIEAKTMQQALQLVQESYDILEPHSDRIYCAITIDAKRGTGSRMSEKMASIEKHIGLVNK